MLAVRSLVAIAFALSCSAARAQEPACATPLLEQLDAPLPFSEFVARLARALDQAANTSHLRKAYAEFAAAHQLDPASPELFRDFSRLRLLFEATRDGGLWRLRWDITNQQPSSKLIWSAWATSLKGDAYAAATATAECDELSALYAFLARRLGVRNVGLIYPTWNHTVAAWSPTLAGKAQNFRVLIPTSQIFLQCAHSFDATSFSPKHPSYEYKAQDLAPDTPIAAQTAEFLLNQVHIYGEASFELLALLRAHRALRLDSSMSVCTDYRRQLVRQLSHELSCADQRALEHYVRHELKSDGDVLSQLQRLAR